MLTARSVIITVVVLATLSILGSLISLLQPPDGDGLGIDTYGTRALGYKAVFDTLAELGYEERRELSPPTEAISKNSTLVIWGPLTDLASSEPTYLWRLRQWIRHGGRLIIAPLPNREMNGDPVRPSITSMRSQDINVLQAIGLPAVGTRMVDAASGEAATSGRRKRNGDAFQSQLEDYMFPRLFPTSTVKVRAKGDFAKLNSAVSKLQVPARLQALDLELTKPDGLLALAPESEPSGHKLPAEREKPIVLAAKFKLGKGEVVAISDPSIFDNRLLSQADNSVLAVNLLGDPKRPLVWDEFYHGLTVRGNPLFLLTSSSYALIAALLVTLVGVWVWRQAVFLGPPLQMTPVSRRGLEEYIDAMSHFLRRSSGSLRFMLLELRRGVLWSMRQRFGLRRVDDSVESVAEAVRRRDPQAARQLIESTHAVDAMLSRSSRPRVAETLKIAKDLLDCH